jgi:hypothetical protein
VPRKSNRAQVDRGKGPSYADAGEEFFRSAEREAEGRSWNSAGVLIVHAAIAWADAVAIELAGVKSTSENHQDAVRLIGEVAEGRPGRDEAVSHLRRIIAEKTHVSYMAKSWQGRDYEALRKHAERFRAWAMKLLGR